MTRHPPDHAPDYTLRRVGDRLVRYCWTCAKRAKNRWAEKNREKVLGIRRASAKRNPETRRLWQREWRARRKAQ